LKNLGTGVQTTNPASLKCVATNATATSEARMAAVWTAGRARYPTLSVSRAALTAHLRALEHHGDDADLYLACACAHADPVAHQLLEHHVFAEVAGFIARVDSSPQVADEVRQQLRERLLVAREGQPPRIAEYAGLGPLGAWVRVAALRLALDVVTGPAPVEFTEAPALAAPNDPELALIRSRYQGAYQEALRDSVQALDVRERTLLRMNVIDGLSVDRLGEVYGVHRATAARWLTRAREHLLDETYRLLSERLKVPLGELRSLTKLLRSDLHLSLQRLL
jgi:RNA polymerase sigma-70 factor, ECF subfamily